MKTAVRIQEYNDEKSGFGFKVIDILVPQFPNSKSSALVPAGHIKFQRTLGDGGGKIWYGMSYNVDTKEVAHLQKMTTIARAIAKECNWDSQPTDVLKVIGAKEYKVFKHDFYPVEIEGQLLFDIQLLGSLYTRIVAPDKPTVQKIMARNGLTKHEIGAAHVISF